ncbi:pyridoxal phosphate-dependent transferase [Aspergillus alliaceus]|uniref:pyridoxal phosphate-dependent transferase n=1 Tax=Petromyces alliaceus TaxID=209559 RepID=UPI0012A6EB01|nr:pyridoxal phosphate-dependent transferase [Aspergillus alliaceus]KAB8231867.1 pyridoxal phosphate-dependent transferase [Aspergillus alliaceus]
MKTQFGKPMREHFLFNGSWVNMNHGSFGAIPKYVRDCLLEKQDLVETSPDAFIRYDYSKHLLESRKAVADLVHAPLGTIALIPNATSGIDTILRNLDYTARDHILSFSTVYGAAERTMLHLSETTGLNLTRIPLSYPLSDSEILSRFYNTVSQIREKDEDIKVAVFDTITFEPGVRMPFEALIAACRELGILSCVDGAHCVGQIPVNLSALKPDFFVSNLHKWLFVPRGCAVLYVPFRNQHLMRTTFPTSWGYRPKNAECRGQFRQTFEEQSEFETLFESFGTMDYSPFLCVADALRFRRRVCGGEGEIMRYNSELANKGGRVMAGILGTGILDNEEGTLTRGCSMVNVRLPVDLGGKLGEVGEWIAKALVRRHRTYVPVFVHAGQLWVRVSAQVYLDEGDFVFLGEALKGLCEEVGGGMRSSRASRL